MEMVIEIISGISCISVVCFRVAHQHFDGVCECPCITIWHDFTARLKALEHFPIAPVGELPFPAEFLLIGGVGEYELLYALPRGMKSQDILIGHGEFTGKGIMLPNKKVISSPPPDYRAVTQEKYLEVTENYYREYFL